MAGGQLARHFAVAAVLVVSLAGVSGMQTPPLPPPPSGAPIAVPGAPTGVALSEDGARLFVAYDGRFGAGGGLAAYRRDGPAFVRQSVLPLNAGARGVAVTPDGRTLLVATRVGVTAVDVASLLDGTPRAGSLRDGDAPAVNQIAVSRDGRNAFFTSGASAMLGVARIERDSWNSPVVSIVGHIVLDRVPGGMALSRDGRALYVTSEIDTSDPKQVPGATDPRLGRARCASNLGPSGVLSVVDTALAIAGSLHAVVARVAAGCGPVRVALDPGEDVAWVSVRGENRVLAFDTGRLRTDATHALLADVPVNAVPVGLAITPDGRTLVVANSHRSRDADEAAAADLSLVDTADALAGKPAVRGVIPTGALAREVVAAPDGTFYVTNYRARRVDVIPPARLAAAR